MCHPVVLHLTYLEVLDSADGAVVLAECVVEDDAGPLARRELGLPQERDPTAFRAANPNLERRGKKWLISSVYACATAAYHKKHLA